ncbi:MAG: tRNA (adenosine(37)-N6)-threonylcarbamoyltransferase complex ATPase subunit type 1 TsaE [Pyrinomonadaceae bacterium]
MSDRSLINQSIVCRSPEETFDLGTKLAEELRAQDVVLLHGYLGAGKTLLTKGILHGLDFDTDEVTSPSFALVNLYKTARFDVYHIDLWRIEASENAAFEIGLDEILAEPNAVVIIEWAERLGNNQFDSRTFDITIDGDGDDPRSIKVSNDL